MIRKGNQTTQTFFEWLSILLLSSTIAYAQTGPGGVGNSDGSGGQPENVLWLDASSLGLSNGSSVASWTDRSGNNNHADQTTANRRPSFVLGGSGNISLPLVRFDNTDDQDFLRFNGASLEQSDYNITVVAAKRSAGGRRLWIGGENTGGNNNLHAGWNGTNFMAHHWGNDHNAPMTTGAPGTSPNSFGIFTHSLASDLPNAQRKILQNGQLLNALSNGGQLNAGQYGNAFIARERGSYYDINVAEYVVYSNALNEAQRVVLENYLSAKYNIALAVNDVYSEANGYQHEVAGIGQFSGSTHAEASSGGFTLRMNDPATFADGEFIVAGHDDTPNAATFANFSGSVEQRWARSWFVDVTGSADAEITFDLRSEGINSAFPGDASGYVLLYRSGTTGDFSPVTSMATVDGSRISFPVTNLSTDGYYTLGSTDQDNSPVAGIAGKVWYTLGSGNWNDPNVWTLDGGVSPVQQPSGGGVPAPSDRVVITNGKTVTMVDDNRSVAGATIFGTLNVVNTIGHNLMVIDGNGKIMMAGSSAGLDNFPAGDVTAFSAANQGTVRLYGNGITLNEKRTFNHLEVYMSSNNDVVTLLNDVTLNGDLYVNTGNFRINDNSATTRLRLTVAQDVTVNNGASMSVGTADAKVTNLMGGTYGDYHESFHVMYVGGNFTNHGQVRFTNESRPDYIDPTDKGAVSLVFTGAANREFNCNGVTDLYNLVIDKGNSQTYELVVNALAKNHFALFGQNDDDWNNAQPANPEMQKALWIKNGTLRLTGKVYIPTLTEGSRDWTIGENAALVLDGPEVFVSTTARTNGNALHPSIDYTGLSYSSAVGFDNGNGNQAIYVNGTLRINDGFFTTGYSHGVVYRAESPSNRLEIHDGEVRAGQFRISGSASVANAKMSYIQTGGVLRLVDNRNNAAIFDLRASQGSFNVSGGQIILEDLSGGTNNAIEISCPAPNINVTGGEIVIDNTTGTQATARIATTAPFYNFTVRSNRDRAVVLNTPLSIINDITIEDETLDANGNDLTIEGDMSVTNAGGYITGSNTTTFVGDADSEIAFDNTTVQTINNFTINKSDPALVVNVEGTNLTTLQISGELRVTQGELRYGARDIHARGNVYNAGIIGRSSTGQLVINGAATQTIDADQGLFNHVTVDNINSVLTVTDLTTEGTLTLANGILNISTHKLTLQGSNATITTPTSFDDTRMIQTAGNASDGGLEAYVNANKTILFPIGTNANSTLRYTPVTATFSSVLDDGYVRVSLADQILSITNPVGDALSYYWRVRHREFGTLPTVRYDMVYAASDVNGTVTDYVGGKVLSENPFTRGGEDFRDTNADGDFSDVGEGSANVASVDEATNTIFFDYSGISGVNTGFTLEAADYTAGESTRFVGAPTVYYNTTVGRRDWDNGTKWTSNPDGTDDGVNAYPQAGDIAIIKSYGQNNGSAWVNANINISVAKLVFDNSAGGYGPRLWVTKRDATLELGQVEGAGTFYLEVTEAQSPTFSATTDLGSFVAEAASVFNFRIDADNQTVSLPNNISTYPRLRIEAGDGGNDDDNRILQTSIPITVNRDIRMDRSCRFRANHDLIIKDSLCITWQGNRTTFEIGDDREVTVDIGKHLKLQNGQGNDNSRILVKNDSQNSYEHTIKVGGDIIIENVNAGSSAFDLYNGPAPNNNAILELTGEGNYAFTNASNITPEFYRVVMNKGADTASTFTFEDIFELRGPVAGTNKAVELQNGLLIFDDPDFGNNPGRIVLAENSPQPFIIPPTAGLEVRQGQLRINGNAGILLDGLLRISNNGYLDMGCGSCNSHRYIEYGSSGNATIEVSDNGWLDVGSQIRRSPTNDAGILKFRQTGGEVSVGRGGSTPHDNRGMLEVLNAGSEFTLTGGSFTIYQQNGANPEVAALILDPETYDLTGSTIYLGGRPTRPDGSDNNFNPTNQNNTGIDAAIPLHNLVISGYRNTPARIIDKALIIRGDLTIENGATLDANGLLLTLTGDMNVDNNFVASSNETVFDGTNAQQINGSATFYDITKQNANTLSLTNNIRIDNDILIASGTLDDNGNTLSLYGDAEIDGTHVSGNSGDGIAFVGSSQQELRRTSAGNSNVGRITINNPAGVIIPEGDGYAFTVQNGLRLSQGVFRIGSNLLTLTTNAEIEEVNLFGNDNMIETNRSASDAGLQKLFAANRDTDFIFPVGQGKYTPVRIDLSSQADYTFGSTIGSIRIAPVSEMHPTITSDNVDKTSPNDPSNVLQYYWLVDADNVAASFKGEMTLVYDDDDASVVSPNEEIDYITAVLRSDSNPNADITKNSGTVDAGANILNFLFDGITDQAISGDYFAGIDLAIPDRIPIYTTIQSGNVDDNVYNPTVPGGIPNGAIVVVDANHTLTFNQENVRFYRTKVEANATLDLAQTRIHSLGQLSGTGTLRVENDASLGLREGSTFFDCGQGTLEYSGTTNYNVLANMPNVNRTTFTGSGVRSLPGNDITICDDMIVNGPTVRNESNRNVTVLGDTYVTSGVFETGNGNIVHRQNLSVNGGTYLGQNGGQDVVHGDLLVSAGAFSAGTGGTVTLLQNLAYTGGAFNGGSGSARVILGGTVAQTISGNISGASNYFNQLEINNSAGATITGNVEVIRTLVLTEGLITPTGTAQFKLTETATTNEGKSTSYVNGILHRNFASGAAGTLHFPVGKDNRWGAISVSAPAAGSWNAEYFNRDPSVDGFSNDNLSEDVDDTAIKRISQIEYWALEGPTPGTAFVHLRWDTQSDVSATATERDNLRVMQWNSVDSQWNNRGNGGLAGNFTYGTLRTGSKASFSKQYFTLGSTSETNALPVELLSFKATAQAQTVQLLWETALEINNDYFEVQRSVDGINFKKIGEVAGNGTTSELVKYELVDKLPIAGVAYYRLKQVDYNGMYEHSDAVSVEWINDGALAAFVELELYPNPAPQGQAKLRVSGLQPQSAVTVKLIDMFGKTYLQQVIESNQLTQNGYLIQPRVRLAAGVYVVSVQQGSQVHQKTLVVR